MPCRGTQAGLQLASHGQEPVPSALHLEVTLEGGFGHVPGLDAAQMPTWEHDLQGKSKGTGFMPPGGGERREEGNCPPLCPWGSEDVSG